MTGDRLFDPHVHSIASDGLYSPLQLLEMAQRSRLAGVAITDHDVVFDPTPYQESAATRKVCLRGGIELSCHWRGAGVHLLGYGADPGDLPLAERCAQIRADRHQRWERMLERLGEKKVKLPETLRQQAPANPGRLHLARGLAQQGYAPNPRGAFQRFRAVFADLPFPSRPELCAGVEILHQASAVVILAHPRTGLDADAWAELLASGIDGIEARFPRATAAHTKRLLAIADERGLLVSGGSDFHGDPYGPFLGKCHIDEPTWERLFPSTPTSRAADGE